MSLNTIRTSGSLLGKRRKLGPHLPAVRAARVVEFDDRDARPRITDFRIGRIAGQSLLLRRDRVALGLRLRCLILCLEGCDGIAQDGRIVNQLLPDQRDNFRPLSR